MDNQEKTPIVNTTSISHNKNNLFVWKVCLFCPIIFFIIFYVWITDIMIKQYYLKIEYDNDEMSITTPINTWYGDKLDCDKLNPCNLTCHEYHEKTNDEGPKCNYSIVIFIFTIIMFTIGTLFIVCNFFKYCIGYICFNCTNKDSNNHTVLHSASV